MNLSEKVKLFEKLAFRLNKADLRDPLPSVLEGKPVPPGIGYPFVALRDLARKLMKQVEDYQKELKTEGSSLPEMVYSKKTNSLMDLLNDYTTQRFGNEKLNREWSGHLNALEGKVTELASKDFEHLAFYQDLNKEVNDVRQALGKYLVEFDKEKKPEQLQRESPFDPRDFEKRTLPPSNPKDLSPEKYKELAEKAKNTLVPSPLHGVWK